MLTRAVCRYVWTDDSPMSTRASRSLSLSLSLSLPRPSHARSHCAPTCSRHPSTCHTHWLCGPGSRELKMEGRLKVQLILAAVPSYVHSNSLLHPCDGCLLPVFRTLSTVTPPPNQFFAFSSAGLPAQCPLMVRSSAESIPNRYRSQYHVEQKPPAGHTTPHIQIQTHL